MQRKLVLTAIVSAAIGAGLMLLATGGRPPAGIEGWTPINAEVKTALAAKSAAAVNKDSGRDSQGTATTANAAAQNTAPNTGVEANSGVANSKEEAGKSADTSKISINRAGLAELQEIPGIGEKKAQAILDYRNAHGPFTSIEELTEVKGIGDKMLEKMKPYIGL